MVNASVNFQYDQIKDEKTAAILKNTIFTVFLPKFLSIMTSLSMMSLILCNFSHISSKALIANLYAKFRCGNPKTMKIIGLDTPPPLTKTMKTMGLIHPHP